MRIAIASRIFEPEPSAASFRLSALAAAFADRGDEVTVLTVRAPRALDTAGGAGERSGYAPVTDAAETAGAATRRRFRVKRFPVLRDGAGYVRGYLPYLTFDVPLFFRILLGPRRGLIVSEPPPTTGFFVRIAAALRRTPYAYYAADIWSDAAAQTGAPAWMVRVVRTLERFALQGAGTVLSVSEGVTARLETFGVAETVVTVGNGVDAARFAGALAADPQHAAGAACEFVYAGTASEWHGADVFVEAMPAVLRDAPNARLRFIGGGAERETLETRCEVLGISHAVSFESVMSAEQIAPVLQAAAAAVASVRPGAGYDFAFPTKLYSAAVCGAPLIYSGPGPAVDFVRTEVDGVPLGTAVGTDPAAVAAAMIEAARVRSGSPEAERADARRRSSVSRWAIEHVGLEAVAERAVRALVPAASARAAARRSSDA